MSATLTAALPSSPLINPLTGQMAPEWRALFQLLLNRTGGNVGVDTSGLQTQLDHETAARQAADLTLTNSIAAVGAAGSSGISSLNTGLANERSERIAADLLLLQRNGGITGTIGFQGSAPIAKPTVSGSKGGNAALASLLTALAAYGLVNDTST